MAMGATALGQPVEMYTFEGPDSDIPFPEIKAKADVATHNSGRISLTLRDGEVCKGRWSYAAPEAVSTTSRSLKTSHAQVARSPATAKDSLAGLNRGDARLTCTRGTKIKARFYTRSGTTSGYGVAKDSRGNLYKLTF